MPLGSFENPLTGADGALARNQVKSPNYVPGSAGWILRKDGSAELSNLVLRGVFDGTDWEVNSKGVFFYAGTPAAGNLIIALANTAGADRFGNPYPQGISSFSGGITVTLASGAVSLTPFTGGAYPGLLTSYAGTLIFTSPQETTADQLSQLLVTSAAAYPSASAALVVGPAAVKVTVPLDADTWHPVTSLLNGWTITPTGFFQYKLLPSRQVMVRAGGLAPGTVANGTQIWAFPAGYAPGFSGTMSFPVTVGYTVAPAAVPSTPEVVVRSSGGLQVFNLGAGTVGSAAFTITYPTD